MALIIADRVKETTVTTGTGTLTLAGAVTQFQTFSASIGNGNTTYYALTDGNGVDWEVGLGTVAAGTLARTRVDASTNSNALINLSANTHTVFCDASAEFLTFLTNSGGIVGLGPNIVNNSGSLDLAGTVTVSKVTSLAAPSSGSDAANKTYVDSIASALNPAVAVLAATTAAGNTSGFTYSNGASGIGATLTGTVNTAVTIDGVTYTALNQRLLVKDDTVAPSGARNGIYFLSQLQTALLAPVFTRALDYDQPSNINSTGTIPVVNGTVNALTSWLLTSQVTAIGTDPLTYSRFSINPSAVFDIAGPGLIGNGNTVSLGTIAASSLMGNAGTVAAVPGAVTIGANLSLSASGTLSATSSGSVTSVVTGAGLTGGTITTSGTVSLAPLGNNLVINSGTIDYDQTPTYFSASRTLAITDRGLWLVDNSGGTADVVVTLPTFAAGTKLTAVIQNNSTAHIVRIRPAGTLIPTIDGVANSDYLLPTFVSSRISIDSTGTAYVAEPGNDWWSPAAGYVNALNGLKIVNNGTFDTNGTLQPVVDGTSIILSSGTISAPSTASTRFTYTVSTSNAWNTVNSSPIASFGCFSALCLQNVTIAAAAPALNAVVNGGSYTATITQLTGAVVASIIANSDTFVASGTAGITPKLTFPANIVLNAGTTYGFHVNRIDGAGTLVLAAVESTGTGFLPHFGTIITRLTYTGGGAIPAGVTLGTTTAILLVVYRRQHMTLLDEIYIARSTGS